MATITLQIPVQVAKTVGRQFFGSVTGASYTITPTGQVTVDVSDSGSLLAHGWKPAGATLGPNTFTGAQHITDTTPSVSVSTGALIVDGGVGIGGNVNASAVGVFSAGLLGFQLLGAPTGGSFVPVAAFYPVTNNSLIAFDMCPKGTPTDVGYGLAWFDLCNTDVVADPNAPGGQQAIHFATSATRQIIASAAYTTDVTPALLPLELGMQIDGSFVPALRIAPSGNASVLDTTASTSSATGALTVAGGAGVAGNFYGGGLVSADAASGFYLGAHKFADTVVGAYNILYDTAGNQRYVIGGSPDTRNIANSTLHSFYNLASSVLFATIDETSISALQTTPSTSSITGALTVAGGAGVAGAIYSGAEVATGTTTVAGLPSAVGRKGARHYVTDSTQTLTAGIGATVVGGGANNVPVVSDGANWKIG